MASDDGVTITWLGHGTTKLETPDGKTILVDAWLDGNPATPEDYKKIDKVDAMLITHAHDDHMADAVAIATRTNATVIAIFDFCEYLGTKGVENCNGMNKGGTINWNGIQVTMVDAIHSSGFMDDGTFIGGGAPAGYVIRFADGFTIYQSGDTDVFEGMRLIGRLYNPDLAILPIGDHFTMGPRQAAEALRLLDVKAVLPVHWGTFPLLTGTPEGLKEEAKDISDLKVFALRPGDSLRQSQVV